ncbi:MAG TPA: hypothetical protein VJ608_01430 [Albitalea sp.]|nr:hypothetical protein [Albitalea sp.]
MTPLQRVEIGRSLGRTYADAQGINTSVSDAVCEAMENACAFMRHGFNQVMKQRGLPIRAMHETEARKLETAGWCDTRGASELSALDEIPA